MPEHKWLLIFLVYSDITKETEPIPQSASVIKNYWYGYYANVIHEILIKQVTITEDIKVVIVNNIKDKRNNPIEFIRITEFAIEKKIIESEIEYDATWNFDKKDDFTKLLSAIKDKYSDYQYTAIFTFGHGSAFGIFKNAANQIKNNIKKFQLDSLNNFEKTQFLDLSKSVQESIAFYQKNITKADGFTRELNQKNADKKTFFAQIETADGNIFDILTNEEFAEAISATFKKADILVMDNCLMQNVYAQYAFKDAVDYFIAPLSGIVLIDETMIGFNLKEWFSNICDNQKNNSPEKIAHSLIESFNKLSESILSNDNFSKFIIGAIFLPEEDIILKKIIDLTNKFCTAFEHDANIKDLILIEVANLFRQGKVFRYDKDSTDLETVIDFFELVNILFTINSIKKGINTIVPDSEFDEINKMLAEFKEKHIKTFIGKEYNQKISGILSCCNVYFPRDVNSTSVYIQPFYEAVNYKSAFDMQSKWSKILTLYFEGDY